MWQPSLSLIRKVHVAISFLQIRKTFLFNVLVKVGTHSLLGRYRPIVLPDLKNKIKIAPAPNTYPCLAAPVRGSPDHVSIYFFAKNSKIFYFIFQVWQQNRLVPRHILWKLSLRIWQNNNNAAYVCQSNSIEYCGAFNTKSVFLLYTSCSNHSWQILGY